MPSDDVESFGVHAATSRMFLQILAKQLADRGIDLAITGPMAWRSHGIYNTPLRDPRRHYHLQIGIQHGQVDGPHTADAVGEAIKAALNKAAIGQKLRDTEQMNIPDKEPTSDLDTEPTNLLELEKLVSDPDKAVGQRIMFATFGDFFHIVGPRDEFYVADLFRRPDLPDGSPPVIPRSVAEQQLAANADSDTKFRELRTRQASAAKFAADVDAARHVLDMIAWGQYPAGAEVCVATALASLLEASASPDAPVAAAFAASLHRTQTKTPHSGPRNPHL